MKKALKWKLGNREMENNQARLEDMKAGLPPWGNGCERRGCRAAPTGWTEVDGIVYEVCEEHRVSA